MLCAWWCGRGGFIILKRLWSLLWSALYSLFGFACLLTYHLHCYVTALFTSGLSHISGFSLDRLATYFLYNNSRRIIALSVREHVIYSFSAFSETAFVVVIIVFDVNEYFGVAGACHMWWALVCWLPYCCSRLWLCACAAAAFISHSNRTDCAPLCWVFVAMRTRLCDPASFYEICWSFLVVCVNTWWKIVRVRFLVMSAALCIRDARSLSWLTELPQ